MASWERKQVQSFFNQRKLRWYFVQVAIFSFNDGVFSTWCFFLYFFNREFLSVSTYLRANWYRLRIEIASFTRLVQVSVGTGFPEPRHCKVADSPLEMVIWEGSLLTLAGTVRHIQGNEINQIVVYFQTLSLYKITYTYSYILLQIYMHIYNKHIVVHLYKYNTIYRYCFSSIFVTYIHSLSHRIQLVS